LIAPPAAAAATNPVISINDMPVPLQPFFF
jgi:hypothetical protein